MLICTSCLLCNNLWESHKFMVIEISERSFDSFLKYANLLPEQVLKSSWLPDEALWVRLLRQFEQFDCLSINSTYEWLITQQILRYKAHLLHSTKWTLNGLHMRLEARNFFVYESSWENTPEVHLRYALFTFRILCCQFIIESRNIAWSLNQ